LLRFVVIGLQIDFDSAFIDPAGMPHIEGPGQRAAYAFGIGSGLI
jgi:hypothetical protein